MTRVFVLFALLFAALPATASAAAVEQLPGISGCLNATGADGCQPIRGFGATHFFPAIGASPDGRSIYVTTSACDPTPDGADCTETGALAILARSALTGQLEQPAGAAGCFAADPRDGCASAPLRGAASVAVSPDGRNVYVGVAQGIVAFSRSPSGALALAQQLGGPAFGDAQALGAAHVAVSGDGRNVYAATDRGLAVIVFKRARDTGRLTQRQCWSFTGTGCRHDGRFEFANSIAVSPAGDEVLAAGLLGRFGRSAKTGLLRPRRGGRRGATSIAFSSDGREVYLAGRASNGSGVVEVFMRNSRTGTLRAPAGKARCLDDGASGKCGVARGLTSSVAVAIDPRGRYAYFASPRNGALVALRRDRKSGLLAGLPGAEGCVGTSAAAGCRSGRALNRISSVTVTRDGRNVYTAGQGGVAAFRVR